MHRWWIVEVFILIMNSIIFRSDVFSRSHPQFHPVSEDIHSGIIDMLNTFYSHIDLPSIAVKKLEGLEVNSSNYQLTTYDRVYSLKRINRPVDLELYRQQLSFSQTLLKKDVLFPRILLNRDDDLLSYQKNGFVWVLAEFVDGEYFSGSRESFIPLANGIGKFQCHIANLPDERLPRSLAADSWPSTFKSLSMLFQRRSEWSTLFPSNEYQVLLANCNLLSDLIDRIEHQSHSFSDRLVPTHIDLHPHNILINDHNQPVFVDVESLQVAGEIQSLAFATYKLARQYVVHEKLQGEPQKIARDTYQFVEHICDSINLGSEKIHHFPTGATMEVLRRIALIIDLNINAKNYEWNAVLPMHFAALKEIPVLFGEIISLDNYHSC